MKLIREYNPEVLLKRAREAVHTILTGYKQANTPTLMLCAGGSSFQLLGGLDARLLGKHLTVSVLDERFSFDPNVNNFAQLTTTTFYREASVSGARFIDMRVREGETVQLLASRFEYALKNWQEVHKDHGAVFAIVGVGADGHVAGIMRYPEDAAKFNELFEKPDHWVVGYTAPEGKNDFPERVTVTLPFLRTRVDRAVAYMSGERKKDAYTRLMSEHGSLPETPGRIIHEMKDVVLYTDIV